MIGKILKVERLVLGLSQVQLASQADVSLPALQQLESGHSNPSIETITKLAGILGLEICLRPVPGDIENLVRLGLPLSTKSKTTSVPSEFALIRELRLVLREWDTLKPREQDAVRGLVLAIKEHYPLTFKRALSKNEKAIESLSHLDGSHIKLKRLALSRIEKYL